MPFDLAQLLGALERAVLFAIRDDGLRLAEADALQLLGDGGGIGGIDIHRARPRPAANMTGSRLQISSCTARRATECFDITVLSLKG